MLIVLIGRKRVGKDTVAEIIKKIFNQNYNLPLNIITLSTPIKEILAYTLNMSIEKLDEMKNTNTKINGNIETRYAMIKFSKKIKEYLGKDVWCKIMDEKMNGHKYNIITDLRYINDYHYFKNRYSNNRILYIKIERESTGSLAIKEEDEVDEIPYDFLLKNNGSVSDLELLVERLFFAYKTNRGYNKRRGYLYNNNMSAVEITETPTRRCSREACQNPVLANSYKGGTYDLCSGCWSDTKKCPNFATSEGQGGCGGYRSYKPNTYPRTRNALCKTCWNLQRNKCPNYEACKGIRPRKSDSDARRYYLCVNCWGAKRVATRPYDDEQQPPYDSNFDYDDGDQHH